MVDSLENPQPNIDIFTLCLTLWHSIRYDNPLCPKLINSQGAGQVDGFSFDYSAALC